MKKLLIGGLFSLMYTASAQTIEQPIGFEEYDPVSTLKVEEHKVTRSKFPFIDVHNHQFGMNSQDLSKLVADMDALNMGVMVEPLPMCAKATPNVLWFLPIRNSKTSARRVGERAPPNRSKMILRRVPWE